MKQLTGVLLIACEMGAGAALAQVSGQVPEATLEPAHRAGAQSWMSPRGKRGDKELHWMAFKGDTAAVKRLLQGGADVNKRVDNGNTPLHLAAYKGHTDVIGILIEHGAELEARNDAGLTALDWTRRKGHREAEKMLLAYGASVGGPSRPQDTAVEHRAAAVASESVRPQATPPQSAENKPHYRIQLGAFNSRQSAVDTWAQCRRRYAGLLGDLQMQLKTVDLGGKIYHRLQTGEFSVDSARRVCAELQRLGQPCIVISPEPR